MLVLTTTAAVIDTTAPVISGCPTSAITVTAPNGAMNAPVTWTSPTATDASGEIIQTSTHTSGQQFAVGTTTVTYTFGDAAGNQATCSFDVVVTAGE